MTSYRIKAPAKRKKVGAYLQTQWVPRAMPETQLIGTLGCPRTRVAAPAGDGVT